MDCGPTCLKMIANYYGIDFCVGDMKNIDRIAYEGSSILDLMDAAKKIGLASTVLEIDINLINMVVLPVILYWKKHHFVVLFKIKRNFYFIADPSKGALKLSKTDFSNGLQNQLSNDRCSGILMTLSVIA